MLKKDYYRLSQLLYRGSNINDVSEIDGFTPLHFAIENNIDKRMIKFLLKNGANSHIEDQSKLDCCDKMRNNKNYDE